MNEIIFIVKESPEGGVWRKGPWAFYFCRRRYLRGTQYIAILKRILQRLSGYISQKKKFLRH